MQCACLLLDTVSALFDGLTLSGDFDHVQGVGPSFTVWALVADVLY